MNIPCEVISDLLPLYIEDMASDETKHLVEDHISGCEACTREMESLKALRLPIQTETESLSHVKKTIFRQRLFASLTAAMMVITLVLGVLTFLNANIVLPIDQVLMHCSMEDGMVTVNCNRRINGFRASAWKDQEDIGVLIYGRMINYLFPNPLMKPGGSNLDYSMDFQVGDSWPDAAYWYVNIWDGTAARALFTGQGDLPTGQLMEVSYAKFFLLGGNLLAAMLLFLLHSRVKGKWKWVLMLLSAFLVSFSVGMILYSGGQLVEFDEAKYLSYELEPDLLAGLPLFVTLICFMKLHQWKKQDSLS